MICHTHSRKIQNLLLLLARRNVFDSVHWSNVNRLSENENPHEKNVSRSRDICDAKGLIGQSDPAAQWAAAWGSCPWVEVLIRNQLLRLARRSDFDPSGLSRASWRFRRTTPRGAPEKAEALSRYPRILGSRLLTGARCYTFKIGYSDSRGGAISALAVSQGHLCGPATQTATEKAEALSR